MKLALRLHALIFCFFLFAFTTTTLVEIPHDVDGKPLFNSRSYYIIPAFRGKCGGGGLELAKTGNETCPFTVVQARSEHSKGLPARLSFSGRILVLSTGFRLNIEFKPQKPSTCLPSPSRWKLQEESQIVKIATEKEKRLVGPFKIMTHGDHYKLVYCNLESQGRDCKDLGISIDDDKNRRLVVKDGEPLVVQFVKADQ